MVQTHFKNKGKDNSKKTKGFEHGSEKKLSNRETELKMEAAG
jgi:hypothetical protein